MNATPGIAPAACLTSRETRSVPAGQLHIDKSAVLLGLFVLLGELPLLIKFFADLWTRPQYDFFPLILLGAAYLAWDRIKEGARIESDPISRAVGATILSIAFLLLASGM